MPAASIELHGNDRRLYACFRASISEDVAVLRAEQLKTRIWRDLLTCMDGRVKDHNFMTLLRPDASLSYDEQRETLFVVPRAQFLMIELARQREGCYDGAWRAKRRACATPASAPAPTRTDGEIQRARVRRGQGRDERDGRRSRRGRVGQRPRREIGQAARGVRPVRRGGA